MEYLTEAFRKVLSRFSHDLTAEDVAHRILDYLRFFFTVVTGQLREVLEAETYRLLVASCGGNEIVNTAKVNRGQLVYDDGRLQLSLLVHQFYDTAVVQSEGG